MADDSRRSYSRVPLEGVRVWLSGAVPEEDGISEAQKQRLLEFVGCFARLVFESGGHLVHGSHPSFTPTLLEEARKHQANGGRKDCLILAVSRRWSKDRNVVPKEEWARAALVYETPDATGERAREEALELLRRWMAARCDVVLAVGGKWWRGVAGRAGVPVEIELALERGLPCFLAGGLGGAARDYVTANPAVFAQLKNGLSVEDNRTLSVAEASTSLATAICDQLQRLPLVRGRGSDGVSFRILALDGGGLKGAFTASALATWEKITGCSLIEHFDLIAGTSTGGILSIGLAVGLTGQDMLGFYRERGHVVFPVTRFRSRAKHVFRHICIPKYSQALLLRELEKAYYRGREPLLLKDARCRLMIPAYHAVAGASHLFRTPHHPDLTADADVPTAHVALATAAAPTFFTAARIAGMVTESSYFDGGVWANSPAMAAIIEAVCFLRVPLERIDVLSVGATDEPFSVRNQTRAGILGWIWKKRILDLLMNVQQESSLTLARHLVGDPRFLRVNFTVSPATYRLDSPNEIEELAQLGQRTAQQVETLGQVRSRFLNGVSAAPWKCFA